MLGIVFLVYVVTIFLVGRTLCLHQYDRDIKSECDMQLNYLLMTLNILVFMIRDCVIRTCSEWK